MGVAQALEAGVGVGRGKMGHAWAQCHGQWGDASIFLAIKGELHGFKWGIWSAAIW